MTVSSGTLLYTTTLNTASATVEVEIVEPMAIATMSLPIQYVNGGSTTAGSLVTTETLGAPGPTETTVLVIPTPFTTTFISGP